MQTNVMGAGFNLKDVRKWGSSVQILLVRNYKRLNLNVLFYFPQRQHRTPPCVYLMYSKVLIRWIKEPEKRVFFVVFVSRFPWAVNAFCTTLSHLKKQSREAPDFMAFIFPIDQLINGDDSK